MTENKREKVIGVGSPVVDLLAHVTDEFIDSIPGEKGGMELVDSKSLAEMVRMIEGDIAAAPGGSAGNTTFALARLGVPAAFLGKLGSDRQGAFYQDSFRSVGGDCSRFKTTPHAPTARCLSMITPDAERTMRTDLGAARQLLPVEISPRDFEECGHAHIEGYLLFDPDLIRATLDAAKEAGCTVSLDFGSFEVVRAAGRPLHGLVEKYVDILIANEEEAATYAGFRDPVASLVTIGNDCRIAAVKLGKRGSLLLHGSRTCEVPAISVERVTDTTGAGDFWDAGFLYGYLRENALEACGRLGSLLGAEVVQHVGASLPDEVWKRIRRQVEQLSKGET